MTTVGLLLRFRASVAALFLATLGWAAGCATPRPMIEPAFEQRAYTPARIAVLPPAVFMVYDQYGDNDPQRSWQLGQTVTQQTVTMLADELQRRGYAVDMSARYDGVWGHGGQVLLGGSDLGWFANSVVQFANSDVGGGSGPMKAPAFVAPELAQRVGWATQSDALLYVNMKGVVVSDGKRTAQILGVAFFVVVVAAIVALILAQSKGGGRGADVPSSGGGRGSRGVVRAAPAGSGPVGGGAPSAASAVSPGAGAPTTAAVVAPRGRGSYASRGGGRVYRSQPRVYTGVHVGVGVMVPMDSPQYTHDGQVADEDEMFAGDQLNVSMTLVSAQDGRVLWHIRDSVDVEADDPAELQAFVRKYVGMMPASLAVGQATAQR